MGGADLLYCSLVCVCIGGLCPWSTAKAITFPETGLLTRFHHQVNKAR